MPAQRLITSRMKRNALRLLIAIILIVGLVNVPWALTRKPSEASLRRLRVIYLEGNDLPYEWPSSWPQFTPQFTPQFPPDDWSERNGFGIRYIEAGTHGNTPPDLLQMNVLFLGWPLPVIEEKVVWWGWNTNPPDSPPVSLLLPGLILNPIIVGGGAWLIVIPPLLSPALLKRRHRRRHHRCMSCGYTIHADSRSPVCTECGDAVNPH